MTLKDIEKALENDRMADHIGQNIALALHLRSDPDHGDRWLTAWGSKTSRGLVRTLVHVIADNIPE